MLTFIVGPDTERRSARADALGEFRRSDALRGEAASVSALGALASSQSLFGDAHAYVVDAELTDEYVRELLGIAPELVASPNLFIFEGELPAPLVKIIEKTKGKVIKVKAAPREKTFDVFALANVYGKRDKKKLWLMYREAIDEGASPEAICGMLAWKARQTLAQKGPEDRDALAQSSALVSMYHDAHRGQGELEVLLEGFILTL
jgi:hypothetical protein